ncbi:hypothetical protein [Gymnodinialimonas hymeniacidonis]|uniref:hypothetical protein n=1 Tax=Gymnodinialimonas hymeniacidonis TaxID=3126508 RepID=UPI0034C5C654
MQTKARFNPLTLLRRFQGWLIRPFDETQIKPKDTDIPDYLRRDVGLPPHHRKVQQRTGDPPTRDPFRLL